MIRAPRPDELARVAAFVAAQQASPESRDAMFDERVEAIGVQLAAWETPWVETSRIAESGRGVTGFIGAELDDALGRVWIFGPLVADPGWDALADELLATLEREVTGVAEKDAEIAADVANQRVAAFARRHGFVAGKVHHLLELSAADIERLPQDGLEPVAAEQHAAFVALHDQLFPRTYYSGQQLLEQAARGDALMLACVEEGKLVGYVAGRIDEAGDGYLDFVGVSQDERRRGLGATLVCGMSHRLLERAPIAALRLTVSSENVAALALYERLGFSRASSAVGYRRPSLATR